ncbi:putative mitochondrial hypothetical protein [Leptomonas pyrrhocoris]|uniref:Pentacotripeptide-repeat region of PRORP domain-containing protein n=1 Tax=Leptomonas pyrrhocoris TaxID=157538 RepID=A0A0N0DYY2_LEPPY|nr:putative mitochondrial hypothetical protein [Leptomonas pyrrhocoris]XP_015663092.1 putative mitochondrial hypothetical protein [Leptomonas pyrrhocoris]KPA84652.1 putative mitochondrial hypothetical protein [Leptomonas pyrrhocoris]KPA84653.1 putative mitochondrial hypothetical protein [Leptomonas pyrrhocoris]|eukprot:XP_015663091.1 putative mitochondrial hypothetical protein [Leptomonas pyrrhocoris]
MYTTTRTPVTLTVRRKDGSEAHFVRRETTDTTPLPRPAASDEHDEIYQSVMECAPYTASFNALLSRPAPKEGAQEMVALVHNRMHSEGIPLNSETYNLLMKRVVRFTDGSIFTLYEELKKEGRKENSSVRPNVETFVLLFRACERSAQYSKAFLFYQQMREYFRLVPDTTTYNTLLGYCAAVRDVAQATFLVEEMKQLEVPRDVNTYNCLMSVMVTSAPYAETMKVFQELLSVNIKPSNRSYNTILKAACDHGDYDRAFQLTEEMKRRGLLPDVETYNYLMSVCAQRVDYVRGTGAYAAEHRRHEQVVQGTHALAELVLTLMREMRTMRVNPDTYTYNKALSTLVLCDDERVFAVFNEMVRDANKSRAAQEFASAPVKQRKSPDQDDADAGAILEVALQAEENNEVGNMRSTTVHPNLETWKELTKACLLFGYFQRAKEVYANMKEVNLTLSATIAHLLLEVCCKTKTRSWAERLLEELRNANVLLTTALMNDYLKVLCAVDDEGTIFAEYEKMRLGIHPSGAWANTDTSNIILAYACGKPTRQETADKLYAAMVQPYSTSPADDETYRIRLESFVGREDVNTESVLSYVEEVLRSHPPQCLPFYHAILRFLLKQDDVRIRAWFDRISSTGETKGGLAVAADVACYTIVMEYYLKHEDYDSIQQLYAQLQSSPTLEADKGIYRVLFEVARRQDDPRTTTKLLDQVRVNSVRLDARCYDSILQTYVAHDESLVFVVLNYMKEQRVAPADSTMAVFLSDPKGRQMLTSVLTRNLFYSPVPPAPLEKLKP